MWGGGYHKDLVQIESELLFIHIAELAVDYGRTDDQGDRYGKLADNEDLPQGSPLARAAEFPLKHQDRPKGGQHQRRIGTG